MTSRQQCQELVDDVARLMSRREVRPHLGKTEHLALLAFLDHIGIRDSTDRTLSELHFVTCESAGLVGEDVFDLTELFDEG